LTSHLINISSPFQLDFQLVRNLLGIQETREMSSRSKKKDKTVKFILQPRPQRDPLSADFEAPQNILVPKTTRDAEIARKKFPELSSKNLLESKQQSKVGMLERAHQNAGMTFDPDLLEAMSKDFDYKDPKNILDDDFLDQAGGLIEDEGELLEGEVTDLNKELFETEPEILTFDEDDEEEFSEQGDSDADSDNYDVDDDEVSKIKNSFGEGRRLILFKKKANNHKFAGGLEPHDQDDNRSAVFTNYSMTSSVMRRNQGLQQLDEHFEKIYEKEYADDTEIGPLDLNEIGGDRVLTDIDQIQELKQEVREVRKKNHGDDYVPEIVSDHHKDAIIGDDYEEQADLVEVELVKRENRVDCESILSYNSNLYNHPKLIVEPRRKDTSQCSHDRMELDSDSRSRSDITKSVASTRASVLSKLSIRPANETPEDRRARKKALKAYRHERRQERKQNQQIFKSELVNVMRQKNNRPTLKLA